MTGGTGGLRFARPAFFAVLLAGLAARAGAAPADEALAKARDLRLAGSAEWLRLGHWKPRLGRGYASDAAREGFFLSPAGEVDPEAELAAMIAALYDPAPGPAPEPPRCRFPARAAWLIERLDLDRASLPPADCSKYEDWRRLMDPSAVSLIFASAYLNNPASMFGHTFLRLERSKIGESERLLDNTLNFAAETGEDGGALFAVKGLLGLYPGKYSVRPYYMMVQQYNNIESRDLWEYRLALSTSAVARLAAHAWELGQATFPYYFFSKNCSYQLMPALEAVLPERSLMPGSPAIVAPVDTVNAALASPGLVATVQYRPSHETTMRQRRGLLRSAELAAADAFRRGRPEEGDRLMADLAPERRALILDAAQDYVLYKEGYGPDAPDAVRELERSILTRRAKLGVSALEAPRPPWAAPPDEGHLRKRLHVGAGARNGGGFSELAWRPGYHDLLDRPRGYVPGAGIEGLSWRLRYDGDERRAYVRDLRLVEVLSIPPWDSWTRKPAWTVGTGLDTAFESGRPASDALIYEGHVGAGLAAEFAGRANVYALAAAEGAAGAVLREGWRVGGSLRSGAAVQVSERLRALLEGGLSAQPFGDKTPNHRLRLGLNWASTRDRAARVEFLLRGRHREGGLYAVLYH
ncbi:MAG: DUF4105 domain-containing protein [Elusimicrobia bacterium]|nr:DUF4105 domain-containing protein [Elusimicrobiota bacterium]